MGTFECTTAAEVSVGCGISEHIAGDDIRSTRPDAVAAEFPVAIGVASNVEDWSIFGRGTTDANQSSKSVDGEVFIQGSSDSESSMWSRESSCDVVKHWSHGELRVLIGKPCDLHMNQIGIGIEDGPSTRGVIGGEESKWASNGSFRGRGGGDGNGNSSPGGRQGGRPVCSTYRASCETGSEVRVNAHAVVLM